MTMIETLLFWLAVLGLLVLLYYTLKMCFRAVARSRSGNPAGALWNASAACAIAGLTALFSLTILSGERQSFGRAVDLYLNAVGGLHVSDPAMAVVYGLLMIIGLMLAVLAWMPLYKRFTAMSIIFASCSFVIACYLAYSVLWFSAFFFIYALSALYKGRRKPTKKRRPDYNNSAADPYEDDDLILNPAYSDLPCNVYHSSHYDDWMSD